MGHVEDRWTIPGPSGNRRVKGPRYGVGKRWRARWVDPDGKERALTFASKDEAQARVAAVDVELRAGSYIDAGAGRITFETYAKAWLELQVHHRPGTAAQAETRLRLHVFPVIGAKELGRIRRSDIQALVATLRTKKLAPSTVRVTYVYVAACFRSAVDDRLIQASPCSKIKLPQTGHSRVVPLSIEEVRRIAAAAPKHLQGMVWLGAGSGMRPGELRGLTIDRLSPRLHLVGDVTPQAATVTVDRQLVAIRAGGVPVWGPGKTPSATRNVVLAAETVSRLIEHLRAYPPGPNGLVFTSAAGYPLARGRLKEAWGTASAGMSMRPRSGWHDLRHHHASLLIAEGLSPRVVADRLGHADPSETLRTYSHLWVSDEERAVAAIQKAYGLT